MEESRKSLTNAFRKVLRKEAERSNPALRQENLNDLIIKFNSYYGNLKTQWPELSHDNRKKYIIKFSSDRLSLDKCVSKVPQYGSVKLPLEIGDLVTVTEVEGLIDHPKLGVYANTCSDNDTDSSESDDEYLSDTNTIEPDTMQALDVIKLVNTTFKPFSGEAAELSSFLINIDVCKAAIPNEHQALAVKCIRGRLIGNASALIQDSVDNYDTLANTLKAHIKPDNSKVLEANLSATVFDNRNLTKFTEDVNSIADKLTSTYLSEGIPLQKANEMTISLVTETCRKSARNDLVKWRNNNNQWRTNYNQPNNFTNQWRGNQRRGNQYNRGRLFRSGNFSRQGNEPNNSVRIINAEESENE